MAGKDTTGTNDTNDYTLGRGIMYLSEIDSTTGLPKKWRDVGNVPDFTVNVAEEELEHFSSRTGLKTRDKTVTLSKDLQMAFSFDTVNDQNLALFLSGETADYTNSAVAGFAEWQIIADGAIDPIPQTVWYQLESSTAVRAYGVEVADLTVATTNVAPVTLVEGTDYEIVTTTGMFRLLDSVAVQLAITNVEGITVLLAANAGAVNMDEVRGLTQSTVSVAMMFQAVNPANADEPTEFVFHQVKLRADGDMNLIGDDWTQMPFGGTVESNTKASPDSPHVTIRTPKAA